MRLQALHRSSPTLQLLLGMSLPNSTKVSLKSRLCLPFSTAQVLGRCCSVPGAPRSASAPQRCPRVPRLTWALQRRGERQQGQESPESRGHHGSAGCSRRRLGGGLSGAGRQAALVWLSPRRRVFENAQLISRSASPSASSFRLEGCDGAHPTQLSPTPAQLQKSFPVLCPGACLWQSGFWSASIMAMCSGGTMRGEGAAGARAVPRDPQHLERWGRPSERQGRGTCPGLWY